LDQASKIMARIAFLLEIIEIEKSKGKKDGLDTKAPYDQLMKKEEKERKKSKKKNQKP